MPVDRYGKIFVTPHDPHYSGSFGGDEYQNGQRISSAGASGGGGIFIIGIVASVIFAPIYWLYLIYRFIYTHPDQALYIISRPIIVVPVFVVGLMILTGRIKSLIKAIGIIILTLFGLIILGIILFFILKTLQEYKYIDISSYIYSRPAWFVSLAKYIRYIYPIIRHALYNW
jgi:hypothetical protein